MCASDDEAVTREPIEPVAEPVQEALAAGRRSGRRLTPESLQESVVPCTEDGTTAQSHVLRHGSGEVPGCRACGPATSSPENGKTGRPRPRRRCDDGARSNPDTCAQTSAL